MMVAAAFLLVLPALWLLVLAAFFAVQILLSRRPWPSPPMGTVPPFVVIIPAHDEAPVIGATLDSLAQALRPQDHAIVVADNCTDATAAIARARGVAVHERDEADRRGKGFALEAGLAYIPAAMRDRPVVFLDADCAVAPDALQRLVAALVTSGRPVQGRYLLTATAAAPRRQRLNAFAIRLKNHARQWGGQQLGVPALMTGSGMAVAPAQLRGIRLGSGEIVEDLVLGLDLCRRGHPPLYCPDALITSPLPSDPAAERLQRARWEQGSMAGAARHLPKLLAAAARRRSWPIFARALDLAVPPLGLLAGAIFSVLAIEAVGAALTGSVAGLAIALAALALFASAVVLAWRWHGRDLVSPADMVALPMLAGARLANLAALLAGRKIGWLRTSRN